MLDFHVARLLCENKKKEKFSYEYKCILLVLDTLVWEWDDESHSM